MSWSLSRLGTYEQCAAKYKFKYIEKIPETQAAAASRGTILHSAIEGFLKGEFDHLPREIEFYADFLRNLRDSTGITEHRIFLDRNWEPCAEGDHWYSGILDYFIPTTPTLIVYDWKTGRQYDEHYDQKEIYSIAALRSTLGATEARAIHVYLDQRTNTERTYHIDNIDLRMRQWEDRVGKMEEETQFIPNPQFLCRYCSFSKAKGGPCRF